MRAAPRIMRHWPPGRIECESCGKIMKETQAEWCVVCGAFVCSDCRRRDRKRDGFICDECRNPEGP